MKKCPTCDKTYEDAMKFCQIDGATLVDDEPTFDPYATIVSTPVDAVSSPADEPAAATDEPLHKTVGSIAISPPDDVLDLPETDPLKTMYASDSEMKEILDGDEPDTEDYPAPEPPSFIADEAPASGGADMAPPPSPFSAPEPAAEEPAPAPVEDVEPATMVQPAVDIPFVPPAPVAEWTPPPAPDANWQNQEIGANTPFQPPPAGVGGENKTLAIISLVTGVLSLFCCGWFVPGIAAVIMGFIAKGKATSDPANYGGAGLALGGMITGGISLVLGVIVVILYLLGFAANLMR